MKFSPAALLLYGIPSAAYQTADALLQDVRAAVAGGVTCIQIRIKHVPTQKLVALAAPTVQFSSTFPASSMTTQKQQLCCKQTVYTLGSQTAPFSKHVPS